MLLELHSDAIKNKCVCSTCPAILLEALLFSGLKTPRDLQIEVDRGVYYALETASPVNPGDAS